MEKNEKDTLDEYRKERKDRIAKQAKKSQKKAVVGTVSSSKADKVAGAVIAVVLVAAIVIGMLNFFGVPQKATKAITIDGKSYSMTELGCYYMMQYNSVRNMAYQYDSNYGEGMGKALTGFDSTVSPTAQSTKDHDGNEITWDEYFLEEAVESMANVKRYYKAALDAGIELSKEDEDEIDKTLESIKTNANAAKNFSVSAILVSNYGKGVSEGFFKKILIEQKYVELYQEARQDELKAAHTQDDVMEVYNKDKTAYDSVDFRWYTIDVKSNTTAAESTSGEATSDAAVKPLEEEVKAQQIIDKIKGQQNYNEDTFKKAVLEASGNDAAYKDDRATFIQKAGKNAVQSNIGEDAAKWFFEVDKDGNYVRQAGDMAHFLTADKKTVYVVFAVGAPYRNETVPASVRHILVKFPTEATSETVSCEAETESTTIAASVKEECSSKADAILKEYNDYIAENESGVADEDYFGELVNKYSDDTGSKSNGGLVSDMANNGSYVTNFEDWVFSEGEFKGEKRTAGTTDIIETEFGYHVMYYVGCHEHPVWYETILDSLISDEWEEEQKKFEEQFAEDAIVRKEKVEQRVKKNCLKLIDR